MVSGLFPLFSAVRAIGLWLLATVIVSTAVAAPARETPAPAAPYRVGVFVDNHPFSHLDDNGQPEGFVVDLLASIERTMALPLTRVAGTTETITADFHAHAIDLLQSFAQTPAREPLADFSVPYLTMAGSIFVHKNGPAIRTFADLRGRRVMVHRGSLGEQLLRGAGLGDSVVYVESVEEALRKLDAGENDATLVSRLSGLAAAHYHGLKNIRPVGEPVPGYTVRYCFAVREGERELLARINEGLAILQRTGEFERIYRKWFGHVDPLPGYTALDVAIAIATGLALACAIAVWAGLRQRKLCKRIAAQSEALRSSEERYRGLFEASQEGFLLLAPTGGEPPDFLVEQSNHAAQRLIVAAPEKASGIRLSQAVPGGPAWSARLHAAISHGGDPVFEYAIPPGRWLRVSASRIGPRVLVVLSDLTDARRAAEQLHLREQQLKQTQKLEALGTLAGGVAHDFNNILTSILGNTDIAGLDLPPGSSVHGQLDEIRAASERARHLVRQILTYTRHAEPRREIVPLTPLVEECLRFLRATVRSSIDIRHRRDETAPRIEGDPTQVHQVLMNLCTNAVHAMGDATGSLTVTEETITVTPGLVAQHPQLCPGVFARIAIVDTGCGMTPEVAQRIFEPFFTTKPPGQGTGLGLSVVHGIMQNHRGAITVSSQPGQGTAFHLYFPVADRPATTGAAAQPARIHRGQGQRLLLIDDEQPIVRAASQLLSRLGYEVSAHHDAASALAEFEKNPDAISLVITDLTMPKITGLEVLTRVLITRPRLPVILASGFMSETDQTRARELGVTRILEKPLTLSALSRALDDCFQDGGKN